MKRPAKPASFSLSLILVCVLVVALAGVLAWDIFADREVDRMNQRRADSLALADELRQSSNMLGRMAMGYVLSGDPVFKRHYDDIAAIVRGKTPRPNEGRVHWNQFVLADHPPPAPAGARTIALLDMLGELGVTPAESAKLSEAKLRSDALNAREVAAMGLVDSTFDWESYQGPALRVLADESYRADRTGVLAPIEEFRAMVDERTRGEVDDAERVSIALRTAVIVICALLVAILLHAYWILRRILGGSVDVVHGGIAALGRGDFSQALVVAANRRESVMGRLAEAQANLAASHVQRERAARLLEESELQFRQIAENIREVFFLADATCTEFFYVSPGYEELWGRTCESLYADPASWHAAIHPEDRRKVQESVGFTSTDGKFEYDCRILRPDSTLRWIRVRAFPVRGADGSPGRIAGFAVDMTHRTNLEVVVRRDGKRFGRVVDHIDVPCFIVNTEGRITYCNEAALTLTGWSRVELLGRASSEILAPFAIGPSIDASNDSGTWRMENRVMARDGSLRASTWRHIRLVSAEGIAEGTAMVAESIR